MGRFEEEAEFVQCLCNPQYLQHLYQKGYFGRKDFKEFLAYLQYWKDPEYSKYLVFPQALSILDLLISSEDFVASLQYKQLIDLLSSQQYFMWRNNR
ncbi:mediator of RNA polymerase II transcription subunit 31 [Nematocida sp. AWRm77]|nr:mediator of RNA polymerase II transcription subunit 31 [Nematocida sp. AWRm77]